jgi:hypothetical protein
MLNLDDHLAPAIAIMNQHKDDDRFSIDPLIPRGMAKKRLELYITEAFRNFPAEFILGLINQQTGELIAFKTGRYTTPSHVAYFYTFVKPGVDYKTFSQMLETGVLETLSHHKVTLVSAVSSGLNTRELNESLKDFGYTIDKTSILLRKIY